MRICLEDANYLLLSIEPERCKKTKHCNEGDSQCLLEEHRTSLKPDGSPTAQQGERSSLFPPQRRKGKRTERDVKKKEGRGGEGREGVGEDNPKLH